MIKVGLIASSPATFKAFILPFINALEKEYQVHVIANFNAQEMNELFSKNIIMHPLELERNPNPIKDLIVLFKLNKILRDNKINIVHTFTPKAGLIGQLASYFSGAKFRFHTFTGQVWATQKGWKREVLKLFDKLIANLATYTLVDSPSQKDFLLKNKIIKEHKSKVLGEGSISGVNLTKFQHSVEERYALREKLGLSCEQFVFLFAGRLKKEKGVPELLAAFKKLIQKYEATLVIVGVDEENLLPALNDTPNVIFCGFSSNINHYFSMADLLCLPSHREGFGNVVIEAAACGLPTLASNIYGLSDAIEDGYSGVLHQVKNVQSIYSNMVKLITDRERLHSFSINGLKRVESKFSEPIIVKEFVDFYSSEIRDNRRTNV
ncbi:glycosyltransferase family 4 protein [Thalassotalea nanhaiensis]|uniref:Glycosyltransferase family 4 protein n=1 Tax=Thalassotalea nanhaiensis TaxID=3065648 RepID=A0ABY9TLU4_9GAMM|nr:glycosyltransferase family 4 protein [Colwelliaceae bacterium SQ345]